MRTAAVVVILGASACAGVVCIMTWLAADRSEAALPPETPTFNRDIAPLVFERCAGCHRPGEAAPFKLLEFDDVRKRARQIVDVTESRYMPPWSPEPGYGEFAESRRLTDLQIETIRRWVEAGTPRGRSSDLPPIPKWPQGWQLGEPDLVVRMPQPYTLKADGTDVFRHFAMRIPINESKYVRAFEFRPGNPAIVHHARILFNRGHGAEALDNADPEPGFGGGMFVDSVFDPAGHWLGWTPGKQPVMGPEHIAWQLEPGIDLVIELHMLPTGKPESITCSVGFFFAQTTPTHMPLILRLGPKTINIPPGEQNHVVTDNYILPIDVDVRSVYAHAHLLCRQAKGFAMLPDGTVRWLLHIRNWDFYWQDEYRYAEPIHLPKGTTLHMEYTYDNSAENDLNPHRPPQRVTWGMHTSEEMGDLWLQVLARNNQDRNTLLEEHGLKEQLADIDGYRTTLLLYPDDHEVYINLGLRLFSRGEYDEAIEHFRAANRLRPRMGRTVNLLGRALSRRGRWREVVDHLSHAVDLQVGNAETHMLLGTALTRTGRVDEAIEQFRTALPLRRHDPQVHAQLAVVLMAKGRHSEALSHLRELVRLEPDSPATLARVAWILATHADDVIRDPTEAVTLAERASELTGHENAGIEDTLAAAYAATGDFDRAVATAEIALKLVTDRQDQKAVREIARHLELFRNGKPLRIKSGQPKPSSGRPVVEETQ